MKNEGKGQREIEKKRRCWRRGYGVRAKLVTPVTYQVAYDCVVSGALNERQLVGRLQLVAASGHGDRGSKLDSPG